jgi:tRNA threonylcarbamoyladenosine biosynthesis protein TsaB
VRVLAVDTTTARGSVAVVEGGQLLGEVRLRSEASHSRRLLPAIAFLLESLGVPLQTISGYAVANGPGSFTGLRIGLSTVQGLAIGHAAPCLAIPALDALAARMRGAAPRLVALMDAYRGELYAGIYDSDAGLLEGPLLLSPERLLERLGQSVTAFLGDGACLYRERIAQGHPGAVFPERSLFLAGTLGLLAGPRLSAGEGGDAALLRPLYVREADAMRALRSR